MQKMYAFVCSSVADAADLPHIFVVVNVVHEEAADSKKKQEITSSKSNIALFQSRGSNSVIMQGHPPSSI